jgi:hypothetical protein
MYPVRNFRTSAETSRLPVRSVHLSVSCALVFIMHIPDIQPGTHPASPAFISRARRFLAHLEGPILAFSAIEDRPVFTVLQECAIIVNTALLLVYLVLARHGYDEGKRKGVAAILEIVSITKTMRPEELDCLDPFGVVGISPGIFI